MGGVDKAFLPLAGRTLIARAVAALGPQVARLAISANGDPARFAAFGCPVLADPVSAAGGREGPLAGLVAGLDWAETEGLAGLATMAVDTPFLPAGWVARLTEAAGSGAAIARTADGLQPVTAIWPTAGHGTLRSAFHAGERRLDEAARLLGAVALVFDEAEAFLNINSPADLAAAEARLAREGGS